MIRLHESDAFGNFITDLDKLVESFRQRLSAARVNTGERQKLVRSIRQAVNYRAAKDCAASKT